jgi:pantoate--beta-alanine ligase
MKILPDIVSARSALGQSRTPHVFVPTMGALHKGHRALIRHGREVAGEQGRLTVSIFLNPMQFGPGEDLATYPSSLKTDQELCAEEGVDFLFLPKAEEIYPTEPSVMIVEEKLSREWCGRRRPTHFRGVLTVLTQLFHILTPDQVILGEKDWQQLILVCQLVEQLHFPIEVMGHPIVRESSGLALSSRNQYLSEEEKKEASLIYRALQAARFEVTCGERSPQRLLHHLAKRLGDQSGALSRDTERLRIDYLGLVEERTLAPLLGPISFPRDRPRLLVALYCGKARLIDNISLIPEKEKES